MNLEEKVAILLKSPTITIYTFADGWDQSMGDNTVFEGSLAITDLLHAHDSVLPFDVAYFQTESGELFEYVIRHYSGNAVLTYMDTTGWKSDEYYADDDEDETTPLYHASMIDEMLYLQELESRIVITNDLGLWVSTDDSILSNAHPSKELKIISNNRVN